MSKEAYDAAQRAAYEQEARAMEEKWAARQKEREQQRQAEAQRLEAEKTVKLEDEEEDGEVIEIPDPGKATTVKAATSSIKSEAKVKDEPQESEAQRTERAAEKAKLAEREAAAEKELGLKQPATSNRFAVAKAAQQASLREKLTAKPTANAREKQDPIPRLNTSPAVLNGRKSSTDTSEVRSPKRNASSAFGDDRRPSKRSGKSSLSSSEVSSPRSPTETSDAPRQPPKWYRDLGKDTGRTKDESGISITLQSLKDQIRKAQKLVESGAKQGQLNDIFTQVRDKLHKAFFFPVNQRVLKSQKILDNANGLPQIFDKNFAYGVDWPYDVKADAEELYNKWCRQDFLTDLMRGIKCGKPKSSKEVSDRTTDKIEEGYPVLTAKKYGNNNLLNGQWWPTQLTCLRDGAHAATQAGIAGPGLGDDDKEQKKDKKGRKSLESEIEEKKGAWSCIMSGGHGYGDDEDHGDWVYYCGTDCTDGSGQPSKSTQKMINSVGSKPVRLIRSHNLQSEWAPKLGFRYDGLYDVVSYERIDPEGDPRARHRFKLQRRKDQDPIRGGDGPERRPTDQEIKAYEEDKRLRGF